MKVALIEDRLIQRIVGLQELRKVVRCDGPQTPQEVSELGSGYDLIFVDLVMSPEWEHARDELILRNPQAEIIEWSAFEDCDVPATLAFATGEACEP